ncbi:MAG: hypothetical protein H6698_02915 [Myxococcales bacterium]|nr:hypothetical protein [Myxococcales bacterium]MCB9519509.1 hypothetical protein [Myxococcales bacterium]MCB9533266.1 hypothetical protein [Myxococcales bacterium]
MIRHPTAGLAPGHALESGQRRGAIGAALAVAALIFTASACGADDGEPADAGLTDAGPDLADAGPDTGDVGGGDTDAAGADAAEDAPADLGPPPDWCEGPTVVLYDPVESTELLAFPDDVFTVEDPNSPTGRRVRVDAESAPWVAQVPALLSSVANDMGVLSGFAANGAVVLRFSDAVSGVPSGEFDSVDSDAVMLFDLSTTPPSRVPFEAELGDAGRHVVLWPLQALTLGASHAVVITRSLTDATGGCVGPSQVTRDLLTRATDGRLAAASERVLSVLPEVGVGVADVAAAFTFTVHNDLGPVIDAAASISADDYAWDAAPSCSAAAPAARTCELRFTANDYRDDRYVSDPDVDGTWSLPVTVWLPENAGPTTPVIVFGHGINDRRGSGRAVADLVRPLGIAVIAADAMRHGDHPTASTNPGALPALDFLGISITPLGIDPLSLRGNFDQTILDRLQLVAALHADPDLDGDGIADVDPTRIGYFGISLGGMLGSGFAALSEDVSAVVLSVAGGRLLKFATDTSMVSSFLPLLTNLIGSEELFQRLIPVAQCLVDPSDPATFGARILFDRPFGDTPPNLLFPVSTWDETVPPATGRALARAIGLPQAGPLFYDVEVIDAIEAPVSENMTEGTTAAYFQFDRVTERAGVVPSSHGNTPLGTEGALQASRFFETWLSGGVAVVIDPYEELATPPLEP